LWVVHNASISQNNHDMSKSRINTFQRLSGYIKKQEKEIGTFSPFKISHVTMGGKGSLCRSALQNICSDPISFVLQVRLFPIFLLCNINTVFVRTAARAGSCPLSWESWSIRSPDTRKIASSNLAESILQNFSFFSRAVAQHPSPTKVNMREHE
jgi:hypothetical protein